LELIIDRFKREARAAGRLRHPNVVDVTNFGFAWVKGGQVAYLVMEYLDGCTLGDVLAEEKKLPLEWVVAKGS
jgi:serine/threonine-protein kinase